jgi:hypothetical protein
MTMSAVPWEIAAPIGGVLCTVIAALWHRLNKLSDARYDDMKANQERIIEAVRILDEVRKERS